MMLAGKEALTHPQTPLPRGKAGEQHASFILRKALTVPCPQPEQLSRTNPLPACFFGSCQDKKSWQILAGVVRPPLTAVPMKGPCSGTVAVSAQAGITHSMGRGVLFRREEVKLDFNGGKKTRKAWFLCSSYQTWHFHEEIWIYSSQKIKFLIFGSSGQVCAAQFLTVKQHIFAPFFFPSSFTECWHFQMHFLSKCSFSWTFSTTFFTVFISEGFSLPEEQLRIQGGAVGTHSLWQTLGSGLEGRWTHSTLAFGGNWYCSSLKWGRDAAELPACFSREGKLERMGKRKKSPIKCTFDQITQS